MSRPPLVWSVAILVGAASLSACTGVLGGGDSDEGTQQESPTAGGDGGGDGDITAPNPTKEELEATCDADSVLVSSQLRRLSDEQLRRSIEDTFGQIFEPSIFPEMGDGSRLIGMNLMANKLNVNDINFETLYDSSREIADTVLRDNSEFADCAAQEASTCVDGLVGQYVHRLWRGLETDQDLADIQSHLSEFETNTGKLRFLVNGLVLGSKFLFRSEIGTLQDGGQELGNQEIASFLSYSIWNSTPDEALLQLADQAEPLTEAQINEQVARMVDDPRVDEGLASVYRDFLKLDLVLTREKSADLGFTDSVRSDLLASAEQMLGNQISAGAHFADVLGDAGMPVNANTAGFFGVETESASFVEMDIANRSGILTHPAFLSVHSTLSNSGIVKRGVFTLEQLLCYELGDPPDDVTSLEPPPELNPETTSERDLLVATHSSQDGCNGCHQFIDPAGFGFENYDVVGRFREVEKDSVPIDASGELMGVGSYENGAEYAAALVASEPLRSCVARRFLEHYFGQDLEHDSCVVEHFTGRVAASDGSVLALILSLAEIQTFVRSRH